KAVQVKHGESKAEFKWAVTNATSEEVTINSVQTSCGCTAARLPSYPNPWTLKPGEGGEVGATMDLTGKFGTILKTVTLVTSVGQFPLVAKAVLPQEAFAQMQRTDNRSRNMQVAAADRQAVFRNDCATCHVQPTVGKHGRDLYAAACGICHEAEHRASMVTQLRGRPGSFPREYWLNWIRHGKEGSLMPAFELKKGGPLGDDQIESLASYLEKQFPGEPAPVRLATPAEGAPPSATAAPSAAPAPAATPTAAVRPPAAP
ncbi:MAG: c-type cytochrome, partial [Verrucomicrobiota bacterium]